MLKTTLKKLGRIITFIFYAVVNPHENINPNASPEMKRLAEESDARRRTDNMRR